MRGRKDDAAAADHLDLSAEESVLSRAEETPLSNSDTLSISLGRLGGRSGNKLRGARARSRDSLDALAPPPPLGSALFTRGGEAMAGRPTTIDKFD